MITTKIGELSGQGLGMTFQKLLGVQTTIGVAIRFKKMHDAYESAMKKIRSDYTEQVVRKYGVFDDKDQLVPDQTPWGFKLQEGVVQEEFDKANDDFHQQEITIDREPLTLADFREVKISASELTCLAPFLAEDGDPSNGNVAQLRR
jgi:hypothetical protein